MTQVHLVLRSDNAKVGPIPVSTSEKRTCPSTCPHKDAGCYAHQGHLRFHWDKVSRHERGGTWNEFVAQIAALPAGTFWRHNQAGDLPGIGTRIDSQKLRALVEANRGKYGFTYTHKPMDILTNRQDVLSANLNGFTINLSADSLVEADKLAALAIAPVVTTLLRGYRKGDKVFTPAGRRVIVCPAQVKDGVTCNSCRLCAIPTRDFIIGFIAHGSGAKMVERIHKERM